MCLPAALVAAIAVVGALNASAVSPPIIVRHLNAGIKYTLTVIATDAAGTGTPSKASNVAIPLDHLEPRAGVLGDVVVV